MKKRAFLFLVTAAVLLAVSCNKTGLKQTTPQTAEDYHARGLEYLNNGDYDNAIADFTQAINLNPYSAEAYFNRGEAYTNEGDYDRAIADYNQAIRLTAPNEVAFNKLYLLYKYEPYYMHEGWNYIEMYTPKPK